MDFLGLVDSIVVFLSNNIIAAVILALALLYLLIRKTKLFFVLLVIMTVLAGALYLISLISTAGTEGKKSMIQQKNIE